MKITSRSEYDFYVDCKVMHQLAVSNQNILIKQAQVSGVTSGLTEAIKEYLSNHMDPAKSTGENLVNILAPGVIYKMLSLIAPTWLSMLVSTAVSVFHVDIAGILESIYHKLLPNLSSDKKVNSDQIRDIVESSVKEKENGETTAEDFLTKKNYLQYQQDIKIIKLSGSKSLFNLDKSKINGLLSRVFSALFSIILSAAGFMFAGDVVNKVLSRPNAFDNKIQYGNQSVTPAQTSHQTKYKINSSYQDNKYNQQSSWVEKVSNDPSSIENMLIDFAHDVYQLPFNVSLNSLPDFKQLKNDIVFYNHSAPGATMIYIPKEFISKKQLIDQFIDQLADQTK